MNGSRVGWGGTIEEGAASGGLNHIRAPKNMCANPAPGAGGCSRNAPGTDSRRKSFQALTHRGPDCSLKGKRCHASGQLRKPVGW